MTHSKSTDAPLVAVAGASGFVGSQLRRALGGTYRWRALTRSAVLGVGDSVDPHTEWRECDLFSLPQVEEALQGARYGIYLVHSMVPSSRLVQGSFADLDLLLADNFARAARAARLEQILYLGGLIPDERPLSDHLASRLEVESVLRESGVPLTVLRAGLIVGPGGSSTQMLINLVRRLPVMVLPKWTASQTRSIDIRDIIRAIDLVLDEPDHWRGTYDLAGHPPMNYREMILNTARILGRRPLWLPYPFHSIKLSRLWVRCVSGVSAQLVHPLLASLTHPLCAKPNPLLERLTPGAIDFETSVRDAMDTGGRPRANPRVPFLKLNRSRIRAAKQVRSVQRMDLPDGWDAEAVARAYGQWLTRTFRGWIRVNRDGEGVLRFHLGFPACDLLVLTPTPFSRRGARRRAFYISGGLLAVATDPPGRFEFRVFPELKICIAAIHGYSPRLPWWLYVQTQARVHLWVMKAFGRWLKHSRQAGNPSSRGSVNESLLWAGEKRDTAPGSAGGARESTGGHHK